MGLGIHKHSQEPGGESTVTNGIVRPQRKKLNLQMSLLDIFTTTDLIALVYFIGCWSLFNMATDRSPLRVHTVSHLMNQQRAKWIRVMSQRQLRIVDTSIMSGLQNGTAFFASTCLLAIGGCFALLGSAEEVQRLYEELHFVENASNAAWEVKVLGLTAIFSYSFFKFGWTYRLFNYCSIIIGAVPTLETEDKSDQETQLRKAIRLNELGGKHFNLGLRGIFFSLGYIGWFLGPEFFMVTTTLIVVVVVRRQFYSAALAALRE